VCEAPQNKTKNLDPKKDDVVRFFGLEDGVDVVGEHGKTGFWEGAEVEGAE
jgi:hypothetical protein